MTTKDHKPANRGVVVAVRGNVVDVGFDEDVPSIYSALHACDDA